MCTWTLVTYDTNTPTQNVTGMYCNTNICMTIGDRWQQMVVRVIKTYENRTTSSIDQCSPHTYTHWVNQKVTFTFMANLIAFQVHLTPA